MKNIILRSGERLEDALLKIREYKKPSSYLLDKYPYYKYCEYVERMESVLGPAGYQTCYEYLPEVLLPGGQVFMQCKCTIKLLSEDGDTAFAAEGIGSREIKYSQDASMYINLNTASMVTAQNAFKSACRGLNIFNSVIGKNAGKKPGRENTAENGKNGKTENVKAVERISFYVDAKAAIVRNDKNTSQPVYRLLGKRFVNDTVSKRYSEIVFYPSFYKNIADKMNSMLSMAEEAGSGKGNAFTVIFDVTRVDNPQNKEYEASYVFRGFSPREVQK